MEGKLSSLAAAPQCARHPPFCAAVSTAMNNAHCWRERDEGPGLETPIEKRKLQLDSLSLIQPQLPLL